MSQRNWAGCPRAMTSRLALMAFLFVACGPAEKAEVNAVDQTIVAGSANPSGCPATWLEARMLCQNQVACSVGSRCSYPGVGDQLPDGRWADGALICFDQSGTNDAGMGDWRCAQ